MKKAIIISLVLLLTVTLIFGCTETTNGPQDQKLDGTYTYLISEGNWMKYTFNGNQFDMQTRASFTSEISETKSEFEAVISNGSISARLKRVIYSNAKADTFKTTKSLPQVESVIQDGANVIVTYTPQEPIDLTYTIDDCFLEIETSGIIITLTKDGCTPPPGNISNLIGVWKAKNHQIKFTKTQIIRNLTNDTNQTSDYRLINSRFIDIDTPINNTIQTMRFEYKLSENKLTFLHIDYTKEE